MKSIASKIAVGLLPAAAVAGLVVAFTGNSNAAVTNTGAAKSSTTATAKKNSGTAAGTASAKKAAPVPKKSTVPACRTDGIQATITAQGDFGRGQMGLVTITNVSSHACWVDGRAAVSLVNAANEVVPVPTKNVEEPGAASKITLKPKTTAFQGIKWQPCDKADETCGVGNTLLVNLEASTDGAPATLEEFPAPERSAITMKWLRVGTLQPSHQGVVAW